MDSTIVNHIEMTPGICGGKPRIAGHRIRVQDIVLWHERLGYSPDEIVSKYPQLTMGDVYAALAYYHDNLETIQRDIAEGETLAHSLEQNTPSKLLQKLIARDDSKDSVSS
ncbi:DUF433 domain-containing protein [Candidatus Entotheonella palauensis]|uniref:DUF433 domain-containing protein n=1 Tax=Candidatus Entotheonella palauensis TaxID=93172 RepID=UPI000B7C740C|nr:DUF433 domain-containing protein [Candidatus Entotheonella palauensis]